MDQYKVTLRMLVPAASVYPSIAYAAESLLREIGSTPEARVWVQFECTMTGEVIDTLCSDESRKQALDNLRGSLGVTVYDVRIQDMERVQQ